MVTSENKIIMRAICVQMLNELLDKKITAQYVIDNWPKNSNDDVIENIYCHLFHYRDDDDIRKKDLRYALWQEEEIRKQIKTLEEGS